MAAVLTRIDTALVAATEIACSDAENEKKRKQYQQMKKKQQQNNYVI